MKLHMHPVSMTSRPILLYIADNQLGVELNVVDLMTGEHHQEPYVRLNPNRLVPTLEDGDFVLTESQAILKYLAKVNGLPHYPSDAKAQAKVDEAMSWFGTNFYKDWGNGYVYPQIFPHHKRPDDDLQAGTLAWAKKHSEFWLGILNDHMLGKGNAFLTGGAKTVADYYAIGLVTLGETTRNDFSKWPNVAAWIGRMKDSPNWGSVNEVFYGFAGSMAETQFDAF